MFTATATETGPFVISLRNFIVSTVLPTFQNLFISVDIFVILKSFHNFLGFQQQTSVFFAFYGQLSSKTGLCDFKNFKAHSGQPPWHPWSIVSQSTNSCSANLNKCLFLIANLDSAVAIAENAQHEPHCPWFCTGLTTLGVFLQSTFDSISYSYKSPSLDCPKE